MYEQHELFLQPRDENGSVWRFMDFTKFVAMLDTQTLFFSRADRLGDPFEGSWPKRNVEARAIPPEDLPAEQRDMYLREVRSLSSVAKRLCAHVAVNCWHMGEHESAAMWKLYLSGNEGVAVRSTYARLRDCLIDDEKVMLGVVTYVDYEQEHIDGGNLLSPYISKRKSFEHEREVRGVVVKWPTEWRDPQPTMDHGLAVRVDLQRLVERVYVAPTTQRWFLDLVNAVVRRYGYDFDVHRSRLDDEPLY